MADYSDAYDDSLLQRRHEVRLEYRSRGFLVRFENFTGDRIEYLMCNYCGVLVWDADLHRRSCEAPVVGLT